MEKHERSDFVCFGVTSLSPFRERERTKPRMEFFEFEAKMLKVETFEEMKLKSDKFYAAQDCNLLSPPSERISSKTKKQRVSKI